MVCNSLNMAVSRFFNYVVDLKAIICIVGVGELECCVGDERFS